MEDYEGTYFGADGSINKNVPRAFRNQLGKNPGYGYDNPLWMMRRSPSDNNVHRTMGKGELTYSPLSWLKLSGRGGWDVYSDERDDFFHPNSSGENNGGRYIKEKFNYQQYNMDLMARGLFDLSSDIKLNALLGFNVNDRRSNSISGDARSFINPLSPPLLNNGSNVQNSNSTSRILSNSYYLTAGFNLYSQVFVNLTGRYDNISTLPADANGVFYPGVDVAWQLNNYVPDDMFIKLRGSLGQVGNSPGAYSLTTGYIAPLNSSFGYSDGWGSATTPNGYGGGFALTSVAGNPNLKREIKTEWELGFDSRFLNDRLYVNFTYYNNRIKDLIIGVDVAPSTGFSTQESNAAEMTNQGVELEIGGVVMKKEHFQWNIDGNIFRNKNDVVSITGVENAFLGGFTDGSSRAVVGEQYGVIFGSKWNRGAADGTAGETKGNDDIVLDANGFPTIAADNGVIGDPNPDFRFGIGNTFKYDNWELYVLFDAAVGMDMWNGTKGALAYFGRADITDVTTTVSASDATTLKNYSESTVAEYYPYARNNDGSYTIRGEIKDFGAGNVIVDEDYYLSGPGSGFTGPSEQFIEDGSWYRFREIRLSYNLRKEKLNGFLGMTNVKFYATVNNAFLFTKYTGNDPNQNLTGAGNNGSGLDYFQNPSTRTYRVGVNLSF
jgi:outer membrane receptor protein involved in Fe transport